MKTKAVELDVKVKQYLLDSVQADGYLEDGEPLPETDKEKIAFVYNAFMDEMGKWLIPQKGTITAITEWLQGLPSVLAIDFYNSDVYQKGVEWGRLEKDANERAIDTWLNNWFNLLANKLRQLFKKHLGV